MKKCRREKTYLTPHHRQTNGWTQCEKQCFINQDIAANNSCSRWQNIKIMMTKRTLPYTNTKSFCTYIVATMVWHGSNLTTPGLSYVISIFFFFAFFRQYSLLIKEYILFKIEVFLKWIIDYWLSAKLHCETLLIFNVDLLIMASNFNLVI